MISNAWVDLRLESWCLFDSHFCQTRGQTLGATRDNFCLPSRFDSRVDLSSDW